MKKIRLHKLRKNSRPFSALKAFLWVFICSVFLSIDLEAQIIINNKTTVSSLVGNSVNISHITGNETSRLMLVGVSTRDKSVTSISYGGTPLTLVGSQTSSGNAKTFIYSLIAPTTGTADVVVNYSGTVNKGTVVSVMTFSGVHQTSPLRNFASNVANSLSPILSMNSFSGDLIYSVISVQNQSITGVGSNQTQQWNQNTGGECRGAGSSMTAVGTSSNVSYTIATKDDWSISGIGIRPVAAADLSLVKSVNVSNPTLGTNVTFSLQAKNNGPDNATLVKVDNLFTSGYGFVSASPSSGTTYNSTTGVWDIGNLVNGATASLSLTMNILCAEDYRFFSEIKAKEPDTDGGNNIFILTVVPQSNFQTSYEICFGERINLNNFIPCNKPSGQNITWHTGSVANATNKVANPTSVGGGVYYVAYEDPVNNCYSPTKAFTVIENPDININKSINNILCFGGNGSITISPSGGTAPYTYSWNTGATTQSLSNVPAGSYTVKVTDSKLCAKINTTILSEPAVLNVFGVKNDITCFGANNGTITLNVTGGTPVYSYDWADIAGTNNVKNRTNLPSGTYQVIVSDQNACNKILSFTINQPSQLGVSESITHPTCYTGGILSLNALGGTAPYTYTWTDIVGNSIKHRSNLVFGTYQVTIADANGCSIIRTYSLTEPVCSPGINVCITNTNDVFSVDPDPTVLSYQWSVPTGAVIVSGQGTASIIIDWSGATLGAGEVCVYSVNECNESFDYCQDVIVQKATIVATAEPNCSGQNLNLFASGGTSYSWTGPNGFSSTMNNPVIYSSTSANSGLYQVTATDNNGCIATSSTSVLVKDSPVMSEFIIQASCGAPNGSIDITVSGGTSPYSFAWSNGDTTEDISALFSGVYSVIVTGANGCSVEEYGLVGDSQGPTVTLTPTAVSCFGFADGAVNTSISGGVAPYSFIWSSGQNSENISGISAGTYTLRAIDDNGCVGVAKAIITEPNAIQIESIILPVSCFGSNDGQISLTVTGGAPNYTYNWTTSNGSGLINGNKNQTNLGAGTYDLTITDANLCTKVLQFIVNQPLAALSSSYVARNVKCFGENNGLINLSTTGGTAPFTYAWSNGSINEDLSFLTPGTYSVTITDSKGCTATNSIVITEPNALAISIVKQDVSCFGGVNGSIDATISGGTLPYTYLWSNGDTTQDINNVPAGSYFLAVTDANNCQDTITINIQQPPALIASYTQNNLTCYGSANGTINLTVSGGQSPYTYTWSNGLPSTQNQTSLSKGTYSVDIKDANNCVIQKTIIIEQPDSLVVSSIVGAVSCFEGTNGTINLNVNGGTGPYTYAWSNGLLSTKDQIGLTAGTYTVSVTDQNSCSVTKNITVVEPAVLNISGLVQNTTCFESSDGSINTTVTGGTGPYTYAWSNSSSNANLTNLSSGTYVLTVTDYKGCVAIKSFEVTEPNNLVISGSSTPNCPGQTNGIINQIVNGGTGPYLGINWSDIGAGPLNRTGLDSGTYSVEITDAQGCKTNASYELLPLKMSISGENKTCLLDDGKVYSSASDGVFPYTFSWSTGQTTPNLNLLASGTYTATITDAIGCVLTDSVTLVDPICLPPVAKDDYYSTKLNTPVNGTVAPTSTIDPGYDSDPDNFLTELEFYPMSFIDPMEGLITWDSTYNGSFKFVPAYNFDGLVIVKYKVCDPLGLCDDAFLRILVEGESDLDLLKTVNNTSHIVGEVVTFSLKIHNSGPSVATNVAIRDLIPSGYANINSITGGGLYSNDSIVWNFDSLAVGVDSIVTFKASVLSPTGSINEYKNIAQVSKSDQFDPDSTPNNDDGDQSEDDEDFASILPQQADLSLVKAISNTTPKVGDSVTFSIKLKNSGPDSASNVSIKDVIPNGYSNVNTISGGGILTGTTINWTGLNLASGDSMVFTYQAKVNAPGVGISFTNTAQVTASDQFDPDSTPDNDIGSEDDQSSVTAIPQQADLSLVKSISNATPNVDEVVTFTIKLLNSGPNTASTVSLKDIIPNGYSNINAISGGGILTGSTINWTGLTLASGDSLMFTYQAKVNAPGVGISFTNTAQVTASDQFDPDSTPDNDINTEDDQSSVTANQQQADLSLFKSISNATPKVSDTITFTIKLKNAGPQTATNVSIKDVIPNGYSNINTISGGGLLTGANINWTGLTLATGDSLILTYQAKVNAPGAGINYTNTAQVTYSDQFDPNSTPNNNISTEDDQSSATAIPQMADLSLVKAISNATPNVGAIVTFTIKLKNAGPNTATNVGVKDVIPNGYSNINAISGGGILTSTTINWTGLTLANGDSLMFTYQANVNAPGAGISYTNTAQVTESDQFDPNSTPNNNSSTEDDQSSVTAIPKVADLSLTKAISNATPNVGAIVTFTITLKNAGPNTATRVRIKDVIPNGYSNVNTISGGGILTGTTINWTSITLAPDDSLMFTYQAKVNAPGVGISFTNTAQVSASDQFDPDSSPDNNIISEDDQSSVTAIPQVADLSLSKAVNNTSPNVGDVVMFTITVNNLGPDRATNVSLKDALPLGYNTISNINGGGVYLNDTITWTIGSLAAGVDSTFSFTAKVKAQTGTANEYKNTAQVTKSDQFDPDSTPNNDDGDQSEDDEDYTDPYVQEIDLELVKSVNNTNPNFGEIVTFRLSVKNRGNSNASNVVIKDYLPNGYEAIANISNGGSNVNDTLTWNIPAINSLDSAFVTFDAKLKSQSSGLNFTNKTEIFAADQQDKDSTPGNFSGNVSEDDEFVLCIAPKIAGNTIYCSKDSLNLIAYGGISYSWSTPRGVFGGSQLTLANLNISDQGTYTVDITTIDGCTVRKTQLVTINNAPIATITSKSSGCLGTESRNNGQILISGYTFADQFQISETSIFDANTASAPTAIPGNGILRNNLMNPIAPNQIYSVRLLNSNACKSDYSVRLDRVDCLCPDEFCIPFMIKKVSK